MNDLESFTYLSFFSLINLLIIDLLSYFQLQDVYSFTHSQLLFNDQFVNH